MENICPICKADLEADLKEHKDYDDYKCVRDSHFYVHRLHGKELTKLKFRLGDYYMKVNFDDGNSQIWAQGAAVFDRVNFNKAEMPDFSDLDKISRKIEILLTFS